MPEVLKFENEPGFLSEFHIEPFQQEYIPGSRILCHEASNGYDVFFQIPAPVYHKISETELDDLKTQVHGWWQSKGT